MVDDNIENITAVIDKAALDELKSIMEDDFTDVLQIFLEESVSIMSEIHTGFEETSDSLIRAVHTLKSCSRNVGAMQLGMVAEKMEELLINKDSDSAKNLLEDLQNLFTQSHAEVKKCIQDNIDEVA